MTPFGLEVRRLRAAKGVDQATMARALGVSPAYLSALERGRRGAPTYGFCQQIINYFGLIWDEAEALQELARLSRPRVIVDTTGMDPRATRAVNLLAERLKRFDDDQLDRLLAVVEEGASLALYERDNDDPGAAPGVSLDRDGDSR
ncbi:helix-turn-helix transcriptional regulator [Yunchengibacter salinarum]|uniref:helix-turn-helix transcriptional regulator n=1 Tax=Yunchengibacter salinarum TaxID=3133399 RepID=UPI0035B5BA56